MVDGVANAIGSDLARSPAQRVEHGQIAPASVTVTQETAFTGRLRGWLASSGLGQVAAARKLCLSVVILSAWLNRARFPLRKHWPAIVGVGIAAESELLAWRPKREHRPHSPSYWVRGARVFTLAEYAARATTESQGAASSSSHRASRPRHAGREAGAPGAATVLPVAGGLHG